MSEARSLLLLCECKVKVAKMFNHFIQKRGDDFLFCITLVDTNQEDQPLIYVNEALLLLTGYRREELTGKNCRVLQNGQGNPESRRIIREAIRNQRPVCRDLLNFRKNGDRFYNRLVLLPLGGYIYLGLQHEISEQYFEKLTPLQDQVILDRIKTPLSTLLLSDLISETDYHKEFAEATERLRSFILQTPDQMMRLF